MSAFCPSSPFCLDFCHVLCLISCAWSLFLFGVAPAVCLSCRLLNFGLLLLVLPAFSLSVVAVICLVGLLCLTYLHACCLLSFGPCCLGILDLIVLVVSVPAGLHMASCHLMLQP